MTNDEMKKQFRDAIKLSNEKKDSEAVKIFQALAEQGHAESQYSLGICYHEGHGVEQDKAKSVEWYRLAAEQGHDVAQYYLGGCYLNGDGIERDIPKAVDLLCKSAARGNRESQAVLDELKKMGIDIPGANSRGKMTFNYLLTHRELPKLYFESLESFYETVITSPDNFERFVYFALNRAKYFAMESPDKYGEPFPESDHIHIETAGDTAETSVIVVFIPNCKEICDCFQIAFTYAKDNPRYFTCELSQNPTTGEGCVIVGEWRQKGEGLSHLNYGLLDIDNKESFAGRVIQIAYANEE